ncbi:MAG: c-type cytochrome [Chitinophagaceae bacterium]
MNLIVSIFISLIVGLATIFLQNRSNNEVPIVKILLPEKELTLKGEKKIQYKISVTDKEDGQTAYEEIADNEVFLKVKFLSKNEQSDIFLKKESESEKLFQSMKLNACFNCHSFQQKLSGPSFREIFDKYGTNAAVVNRLSAKIIKGSKGVWSDSQQMPAHPELHITEANAIAKKILEYGADKDLELYTGSEGFIKTTERTSKGTFLLIASYLDHGMEGKDQKEGKTFRLITLH